MDSLTQIVLGASVAEASLGKKIGNKAIVLGAISGTIIPVGGLVMVTATNGPIEISSYTNLAGEFLLSGVPDGTYTVAFQADLGLGIPPLVVENVTVVQGEVTAMGEIDLEP